MQHTVMAVLRAKSGKESQLRDDLVRIGELTRQEEGCMSFQLYHDTEDSAQFGLFEQWSSKEQYQQQFDKPYVVEFLERVNSLVERPYRALTAAELSVQ